jgi:hypothetical protein
MDTSGGKLTNSSAMLVNARVSGATLAREPSVCHSQLHLSAFTENCFTLWQV